MKKAGSRTGNGAGLSLVEVLLAIAVVSAGALFVTPLYFKASDAMDRLAARFQASLVAGNLIVETERELHEQGELDGWPRTGRTEAGGRPFAYRLFIQPADPRTGLYEVTANVEWGDAGGQRLALTGLIRR